MRRRAWTALALVALAVGVGLLGHAGLGEAFSALSGLFLLVAAVVALSLLPWHRVLPPVAPMPGLFAPPRPNERWCSRCGQNTPEGPCTHCGHAPADRRAAGAHKKAKARRRTLKSPSEAGPPRRDIGGPGVSQKKGPK